MEKNLQQVGGLLIKFYNQKPGQRRKLGKIPPPSFLI